MTLSDAHVHFFCNGYRTRYGSLFPDGREVEIYDAFRKAHGVREVLAVGYEGASCPGNNQYLAELAASREWIYPVAYCRAASPPSCRELSGWWRRRFVGISLYPADRREAEALLSWPVDVLEALNTHQALVSVNVSGSLLPRLMPFFAELGGCHLLISHLGLFNRQNASLPEPGVLSQLARLPHLGVKASAFYAYGTPQHIFPHRASHSVFKALLEELGEDRLYWGSDFSPALEFVSFAQCIEMLNQLDLNEAQMQAIGGGNLRRVLGSR